MLCNAEPVGFIAVGMVTGLINSFPGNDGIDSSVVVVLLGIDTIRESTSELVLGYNKKKYINMAVVIFDGMDTNCL